MNKVAEEDAKIIPNLPGVSSLLGLLRCAETVDRKQWTAKNTEWPWEACRKYPVRVGAEYVYYALAHHNQVPMPAARVLRIGGDTYWGTEILKDRVVLGARKTELTGSEQEAVVKALAASAEERLGFLKMLFLDVFLLNADRTRTNVLKEPNGDKLRLTFIDHEQSGGWRNEKDNAEKNRIMSPADEYDRIKSYTQFEDAYHWGVRVCPDLGQREVVFKSLKLEPALLDQIRPWIPPAWFPEGEFNDRKVGLSRWWEFLSKQPYKELDQRIFG